MVASLTKLQALSLKATAGCEGEASELENLLEGMSAAEKLLLVDLYLDELSIPFGRFSDDRRKAS